MHSRGDAGHGSLPGLGGEVLGDHAHCVLQGHAHSNAGHDTEAGKPERRAGQRADERAQGIDDDRGDEGAFAAPHVAHGAARDGAHDRRREAGAGDEAGIGRSHVPFAHEQRQRGAVDHEVVALEGERDQAAEKDTQMDSPEAAFVDEEFYVCSGHLSGAAAFGFSVEFRVYRGGSGPDERLWNDCAPRGRNDLQNRERKSGARD